MGELKTENRIARFGNLKDPDGNIVGSGQYA